MPEEFLVAGRRIDTKIMTAQKFGFELLSVVKPTKTLFQKNHFFATSKIFRPRGTGLGDPWERGGRGLKTSPRRNIRSI